MVEIYGSTLQTLVRNDSHFGDYKCKVANPLGIVEQIMKWRKRQKPIGRSRFQLKRAFTDGLKLDIRSVKFSSVLDNMQTIGYRVEYMSENEFKYCVGNWSYAKRRYFVSRRDGRRFMVTRLQTNTTYLMRAASFNVAGLNDWKVR
uniref:Fibronectin type-III domain-containing protein n=1 Tax=Glossina brevipalpis TaxID=37001 RepID=A0A1A9X5I8_9MUSC